LATTACGAGTPSPTGGAGNGDPSDGGNGGSGDTSGAGYAVKSDLCAEADLAPIRALFPVVQNLKAQDKIHNDVPIYYCDGEAGTSDDHRGIGFLSMAAHIYGSPDDASEQYDRIAGSTFMTEKQPVSGLGQQAVSYNDGRGVGLSVVDGRFYLVVGWTPNGVASTGLRDQVRDALADLARATMAKLKTA
jgi:hypothetical protein